MWFSKQVCDTTVTQCEIKSQFETVVLFVTPHHMLWIIRSESDLTWSTVTGQDWWQGVNLAKRRCVLHTSLCEESMRWDRFRQLILTLPSHWGRFTMTAADNKLYPITWWKRKREWIDNCCLRNSAVYQCVWFCDQNFCLSKSN